MRIGYQRVSSTDQHPELQTDALAAAQCEHIYREKVSGAASDRPQLEACLAALRPGDTLVVWRLDRLGRTLRNLVELVAGLEERDVGFCSLKENIDTTTASGRLVFHIFASLAEFERDLMLERTMAGLAAARARGRTGGRREKLSNADARKAAAMLNDPKITKAEVAEHFGVARGTLNATLKRHNLE